MNRTNTIIRLKKVRNKLPLGSAFLVNEALTCRACNEAFSPHLGRRVYSNNRIEEFCSKRCRVRHYR